MPLRPSYSSVADDLLGDFYVPALSRASGYDRIAGYFASSSFVSAAAGLARFVNGGGSMRMIVGAQLRESDRAALRGDADLDAVLADRLTAASLSVEDVARARLQVLAWMVREGRLEMRVGVACGPDGEPLAVDDPGNDGRYFHIKTGILHDAGGDAVVFSGSVNESSQGWARNFEHFNVYMSWKAGPWADYGEPEVRRFERLWSGDAGPGWRIVALPEAFEGRLLEFVPDDYEPPGRDPAEPPAPEPVDPDPGHGPGVPRDRAPAEQQPRSPGGPAPLSEAERRLVEEIRDAPSTRTGVGLASAAVEPWPHQLAIARRILDTWPRSYLLADQVGLGKTIEVGLVLRELLLSGRAASALILVPASVLIQWQQELCEKFCLDVARIDGADLVFSDPARRRPIRPGDNPWAAERVLLASSHLARRRAQRQRLLQAPGWDLVVLDEAHHARRRGSQPGSAANQMLALLRDLEHHRKFEALLLASATPMQMHPRELWDLLDVLGLPERWGAAAEAMARYYRELGEPFDERGWDFLRSMVRAHLAGADAPSDRRTAAALAGAGPAEAHRIRGFADDGLRRPRNVKESSRPAWDEWLRACTPVRDRVFRTTRLTLRSYLDEGLLPAGTVIPERSIEEHFDDLGDAEELYGRIDGYIRARYEAYAAGVDSRTRGMGFIMTVYRRRLTSSFHAVRCSLQRRRQALSSRSEAASPLDDDSPMAPPPDGGPYPVAGLLDDDDRHAAEGALGLDGLDEPAPAPDPAPAGGGGHIQMTFQEVGDLPSELDELDRFIDDLDALAPDEPKMQRLADILAGCFARGHRSAVVFTQYADTLRYIRGRLLGTYRNGLACYYGGTGEMWDDEHGCWAVVGKERIKSRFRSGDIQILIGTDSMSEGLNLQTCDVMVNFDMPWNFTRVEQRIGRLDRIGGMPHIAVHNLYYRDTVEVDIHERLRERFDSFEGVLGRSAPVLAAMEDTLLDAAMGTIGPEQAFERIDESVRAAEDAPMSLDDLDAVPEPEGELAPAMTLEGLRDRLLSLPAAAGRLVPDPRRPGVRLLSLDAPGAGSASSPAVVAFDRGLCADNDDVALLTWGSPLLDALLDRLAPRRTPRPRGPLAPGGC